jgi:hypothetical protein
MMHASPSQIASVGEVQAKYPITLASSAMDIKTSRRGTKTRAVLHFALAQGDQTP